MLCVYQSKGIIPHLQNPTEGLQEHLANDPNRRIYTKEQVEEFRKESWFREEGFIVHELRRHNVSEKIPRFRGWNPSSFFDELGFKFEDCIDLVTPSLKVYDVKQDRYYFMNLSWPRIFQLTPEEFEQRRAVVGTEETFERSQAQMFEIFTRLNQQNIDFVMFRTYSSSPALVDKIHFYSAGDFQIGKCRSRELMDAKKHQPMDWWHETTKFWIPGA